MQNGTANPKKALQKYRIKVNRGEIQHTQGMNKQCKQNSKETEWRNYCQKLNPDTSVSEACKQIKAIKGSNKSSKIPTIKQQRMAITDKEKVGTFTTYFHEIFSNKNTGEMML